MVRINTQELWEQARKEGALTPEVEARLAKERSEGIEILLSDLENRDYLQMKISIDDMTEDQLSRMVNSLPPIRLAGLISYLTPSQVKRALALIKSEKQRQLLQLLLEEQTPETTES